MTFLKPLFSLCLCFTTACLFVGCQQQQQGPTPGDTIIGKHYDGSWTDDVGFAANGVRNGYQLSNDDDVVIPVDGANWGAEVVYDGGVDGSLVTRDPALLNAEAMANFDGLTPYTSIYFGFDQYGVSETERPKLSQAAQQLLAIPGAKLIAEGHTDWRGTTEYNLALGDRRANSVRSYLINLGAPNAISVTSKGELEATENIEKNDPRAQADRRVDVFIIQ